MNKSTAAGFAVAVLLFSCNQSSNKEVEDAKENLTEAKSELKEAKANEHEATKSKETAEWNQFKHEADSTIVVMEDDLKKLEMKIEKADKKVKEKLKAEYASTKRDTEALKEKLRRNNVEFESDINRLDNKISDRNQSFKREFKHDMDELGKSMKDLFKDNVK